MDWKTKKQKISLSSPVQQAQCPLHRHHIQISAQFRIALTSKNTRFANVLKQKMDKLYMVNFEIVQVHSWGQILYICFYASQLNLPYQNSQQACTWDLMVEVSTFHLQCWITSWLGSWYIVHHIWAWIFSRRCPTKMSHSFIAYIIEEISDTWGCSVCSWAKVSSPRMSVGSPETQYLCTIVIPFSLRNKLLQLDIQVLQVITTLQDGNANSVNYFRIKM